MAAGRSFRELTSAAPRLAVADDSGEKMAPFRVGLTPVRRAIGAALVVLLMVGAVLYYRTSTSASVVAPGLGAPSSAAPTPVVESDPTPSTPTPSTPTPKASVKPTSAEVPTIRLYADGDISARPFQTVAIRGTYHGGPNRLVHAERREGAGRWLPFPLSAKTDGMGRFITHVELSRVGHHWVRVVDPKTRIVSEPMVVVIRG